MKNHDTQTTSYQTTSYQAALWTMGAKYQGDHWYENHRQALRHPHPGFETALLAMLQGWLHYADAARSADRSSQNRGIGLDYVLAPHWAAIGQALRGLLNGETGRFDCGLMDSLLAKTLQAEECEEA